MVLNDLLGLHHVRCQPGLILNAALSLSALDPHRAGGSVQVVAVVLYLHQARVRHLLQLVPGGVGVIGVGLAGLAVKVGPAANG